MSKSVSSEKKYNFATMLYEESAVENWLNIVKSWHIKGYVSPLHDKDVWDEGEHKGEPKKPHWHLLLHFDSARSPKAVREKFISIGGVGCEIIDSFTGYARYLCHLDDQPEKALYDTKDVISLAGACYEEDINKGQSTTLVYAEIMDYIDDFNIKSYAQILSYSRHFRMDWFEKLCKNGMVIKDYIRSRKADDAEYVVNRKDNKPWNNDNVSHLDK